MMLQQRLFSRSILRCSGKISKFHDNSSRSLSSSVDKAELQKFEQIGREWWNPNSKLGTGPLHSMNPVRVSFIKDQLLTDNSPQSQPTGSQVKPLAGVSMLDVGCGGGLLAESLCRLGARATAIDPAEGNIQVARWHAGLDPAIDDNIDYRCCSVEAIAGSNKDREVFDCVTCLEVIEHVEQPEQFLHHCLSCVRPGGSLFVSTLNRTVLSKLAAVTMAEHVLGLVPPGTHDWHRFVTPEELRTMVERFSNTRLVLTKSLIPVPGVKGIASRWEVSDLLPPALMVNYIARIVRLKD